MLVRSILLNLTWPVTIMDSQRFILHSMIKSMFKKWTHSESAVGQKIPARSGGQDSEGVGDERNKVNR
jgi:hypothetical protein